MQDEDGLHDRSSAARAVAQLHQDLPRLQGRDGAFSHTGDTRVGPVSILWGARRPVPVMRERGPDGAAPLIALVGAGHHLTGGRGVDQPGIAGGGQIVHCPGRSRRRSDQPADGIGDDRDVLPVAFVLARVVWFLVDHAVDPDGGAVDKSHRPGGACERPRRGKVARVDGGFFGEAISECEYEDRQALQLSRRSIHWDHHSTIHQSAARRLDSR